MNVQDLSRKLLVVVWVGVATIAPAVDAWHGRVPNTHTSTPINGIRWLSSSSCASKFRLCSPSIPLRSSSSNNNNDNIIEWSDFDDYVGDIGGGDKPNQTSNDDNDDDPRSAVALDLSKVWQDLLSTDYSACRARQFSMGTDLVLTNFVGNMGFDEVTDWEYYYQDVDDDDDDDNNSNNKNNPTRTSTTRQVVQPNPFDPSKPKRTRTRSGSVVRIFRGEFVGLLGGGLSASGLDRRILVKEFSGELALALARSELETVGRLQSHLLLENKQQDAMAGKWVQTAASRSVMKRQDNTNVMTLVRLLMTKKAPFLGILGEVNLAETDGNIDANLFYRQLSVPPPKPDAIWIVYEYAGLSTLQAYARPAQIRRAQLPPKRGVFGNLVDPPPLPAWPDRANYVVRGVIKGAIESVGYLHDLGIVHRSIGRASFLLSSPTMDKAEAATPYATRVSGLHVKLADFGFSGLCKDATRQDDFCSRARSFGLHFVKGEHTVASTNFSIAEDMHALGFVVIALLLTSLAVLPESNLNYPMPATDEDTLQRLLGEIFDKDIYQFRDYVEADDVWSKLVQLLDEKDGAGWKVLETLFLAREKAAQNKDTLQLFSVRGLLSNPFFN